MRAWIRKISLKVADESGKGLDLSELRITFHIKKTDTETPNDSEIRVYNLEKQTALKIQKEFTQCELQAGYQDNFGLIFAGNTKQILLGRENATDSYLSLLLGDGDEAYNFAYVNHTIGAGTTHQAQVAACLPAFGILGVLPGYFSGLGATMLPRGKVMYGRARDYMRQSAQSTGTAWSIQDGKINMVPLSGLLPGMAFLLTSQTGLIDTPEQTNEGIKIKCLLNPMIKIGGMVNIKDAEINTQIKVEQKTGLTGVPQKTEPIPMVSNDGSYKVIAIEYNGDTRGNEWYQTLTCLDIDATVPSKKVKTEETPWGEGE